MSHLAPTDDFRHGPIVVVAARWLLAVAGLLFLLYRPASTLELAAGTLGVLAIAAVNFWIHTRLLTRQPLEPAWLYGATAADLTVITWLVAVQGGLAGNAFVFYYPAMLAFSLVFPRAVTMLFTASALSVYAVLCLNDHVDERVLVARVLSLAAVAFLGSRYQQVEAHRRARRAELAIATPASSPRLEAEEDVFYGQIVCITARWFVIAGAVFLALWRVSDVTQMQRHLIPLLALVAANFFLHGRYLMGLPANRLLLELASVLDLAVITAILLVVAPDGARGLRTPFFV